TVSLKSAAPGELRYSLDGSEPTAASPVYTGPITIDHKSASVRAGVFADKKRIGDLWGQGYTWKNHQTNLTTGKLAAGGPGVPDNAKPSKYEPNNPAFDGAVERETMWSQHDGPGWLKVDLEASHKLNEIHLYTWYGDGRSYQYYIEVSQDDKTWTKVADASTNTTAADEQGYRHKFNPVDARYIRVVLTKNTANPAVHVVELRAFEAK
ncbi:MAG: discoidin domain-containing protein, partial [Planctomycetota bacterium]|nr:discoidin domain-containing protein [Planctomycetota bacterium]